MKFSMTEGIAILKKQREDWDKAVAHQNIVRAFAYARLYCPICGKHSKAHN